LEKVFNGIIHYFNSGERDIYLVVEKDGAPFVLFNEREVSHMRDVKGLIRLDYYLLLSTLIYAVGFTLISLFLWKDRRRLARGLFGGGVLTLGLMAALGLGALLDFDSLFLQFHLISFDNYLWMLDPSRDYLIRLFPQGFYYDATLFCAAGTAAGALIMGGVGWWYIRKGERNSPSMAT
jgi:integral membrane protein (TIGR01906 family)